MNSTVEQIITIFKAIPLSKKIGMGAVVFLVIAGFAAMFFWANKIAFEPVYSGLSQEDAAAIVEKLKEENSEAVVHLVASAVEGLSADMVTSVDASGNVLSKGASEGDAAAILGTHLEYKTAYEKNLTQRIQSMLEKIVGKGKAIVRVTADMDFNQIDVNEEVYDPDSQTIRSSQNMIETSEKNVGAEAKASTVNPTVANGSSSNSEVCQKKDETMSYEINRTIRRTIQPAGRVNRLSVVAVLDGSYELGTDDEGEPVRKYVERSKEELNQFITIVKNAMGYSEDREDQISVESFPFHYIEDMAESPGFDYSAFAKKYSWKITNGILIIMLFMFVVLPLIKFMKEITATVVETARLPDTKGEPKKFPGQVEPGTIQDVDQMSASAKSVYLANQDMGKTVNILRFWLNEEG